MEGFERLLALYHEEAEEMALNENNEHAAKQILSIGYG